MSQGEIMEVLEHSNVPLSSREIAEKLNQDHNTVVKRLRVLLKYKEVEIIELNKDLAMKFYKCKRRMKLFYV